MKKRDMFAGPVIKALETLDQDEPVLRAIDFLRSRLTDAAIAGCHHCGEGESSAPCWWCGLRNMRRRKRSGGRE